MSWTIDTLKEHLERVIADGTRTVDRRFVATEHSLGVAIGSVKEAAEKATAAQDRRNELQNEFRGQLSDQARQFMPRAEFERLHDLLAERVQGLEGADRLRAGQRLGAASIMGYVVGCAGAAAAVLVALVH